MQLLAAIRRNNLPGVAKEIKLGASVNAFIYGKDTETALHLAAGQSDCSVEILELLLSAGAEPMLGRSPAMFHAARSGNLQKVKILIQAGTPTKYFNKDRYNATHSATITFSVGAFEVLQYLVAHGCDPSLRTTYYETPLAYALSLGHLEVARWLLENGGIPDGWPPLFTAIVQADIQGIRAHAKDIGKIFRSYGQWSPMFLAAVVNDPSVADVLVSLGVAPGEVNHVSANAVCTAASSNSVEMLRWFRAHDVPFCFSGALFLDALVAATGFSAYEATEYLLRTFPEETANSDCLNAALSTKSPNILNLLIERGANVNFIDGEGETILMGAAREGDLELTRFLLSVDADPNATSTGATAVHAAVQADHEEIVRLLIDAGGNPNAEDVDGDTPLMYCQSVEVARLLLSSGANPNAQNPYLIPTAREMLLRRDPRFAEAFG